MSPCSEEKEKAKESNEKKQSDNEEEEQHEQVKENKNFTKKLPERKDAVEATFALYRGQESDEEEEKKNEESQNNRQKAKGSSSNDSKKDTTTTATQTEKVEFAKKTNDPMADFKSRVEESKNEKLRKQVAADVEAYRKEHRKRSDDEEEKEIEPSEKAKEIKSKNDTKHQKEGVDKKFEQKEKSESENMGKAVTSNVAVSGQKQPEGKDVK